MTTIAQDMATDYLNWVDPETGTLTFRRSSGDVNVSLGTVLRHAITTREVAASAGRLRASDVVFHLPVSLVNAAPNATRMIEPNDQITITAAIGEPTTYLVQEARLAYRNNKWRCVARRHARTNITALLLTSLLSYWKLDEASGTRSDELGNSDLTDNNTVGSAAGKVGNAADFEKTNDEYLSAAHNANQMASATTASWSFWINPESLDTAHIFSKGDYGTDGCWHHHFGTTLLRLYLPVSAAGSTTRGEVTHGFSAGSWYHVVWVYDGTATGNSNRLKCWIDGTQQTVSFNGTIPAALQASTTALVMGNHAGLNALQYYDGMLDEVGIWSKALTAVEIAALHNGGSPATYPDFS